jgi:hypothetical protein
MVKTEKVYLAIRKRFLKLFLGKYFVISRRGRNFLIDIDDHVSRQIEAYDLYEKKQVNELLRLAEKLKNQNIFWMFGGRGSARAGSIRTRLGKHDRPYHVAVAARMAAMRSAFASKPMPGASGRRT